MSTTNPVLIVPVVAAALFIAGCNTLPEKNIYTEIDIEAPAKTIWEILTDIERYPDWNPYHVSVAGKLSPDEELSVKIHKPNGENVNIEPHVLRLLPHKELTWGGGIKGIFIGEHVFLLESASRGFTKLIHKERFSGFAVPFASLDAIEEGYNLMNVALKKRAESMVE